MSETTNPDDRGSPARARIECLVGAYPNLREEELRQLLDWYRREASSLDVAMLSAREDIRSGYKQFYNDHIARISRLNMVAVAACSILFIALIYWIATQAV